MSGFDPSWLALREPYDHAVRDADLTHAFVDALGPVPRLIDLGCGTGSNVRYLAPRLNKNQRWTCVDYDPRLLQVLEDSKPSEIDLETRKLDLAQGLEDLSIQPGMGVTGAALLDLASAAWLDRLAGHCREVPVLMTLSFDGRIVWSPGDIDDEAVNAAFSRHQRSDKGFGPALGPDAGSYFADGLRQIGHEVRIAPSDWVFDARDGAILEAMVDGISAAAEEVDPNLPLEAWRARRRLEITSGDLLLMVGHIDLLSLP